MFFKRLKIILISFFFLGFVENSYSIEPSDFVQLTVNKASDALNSNFTKEKKIEMLKIIAKETVDIRGIGFYTLGSHRKNITDDQKGHDVRVPYLNKLGPLSNEFCLYQSHG